MHLNMKKIPISILFILFTTSVFGQNITFETSKKLDEFTKALTISVSPKEERLIRKKVEKSDMSLTALQDQYSLPSIVRLIFRRDDNGSEVYYLNFKLYTDLGCMSKYDGKAIILFEGGETLELAQISDTDCGDSVNAIFLIVPRKDFEADDLEAFKVSQNQSLKMIQEKKILKIRINGTEFYKDLELRPEVTDIFQKMGKEIEVNF